MRKNFGAKPFTYPQPVFIIAAYDENGTPNAMNAAWGGISEMHEISICISEGHKTTANILKRKAFTVSMAEVGQVIACDYVGIVSGNRVSDNKAKDYADMSRKAANIVSAQVIMKPNCVLGLATGSTPIGLYKQLVEWFRKGDLDFYEVMTVNLDEYKGLSRENDQSYYYFMHQNLFDHVNIPVENTHLPNGMEPDSEKECRRYTELIQSLGGVDLQLLGIGHNGHIGFNEPGESFDKQVHCVNLTESTIEANKRFFASAEDVPKQAYTMGIKTIMQAKKILIVASGEDKAEIVQKAFFGPITPQVPASVLQLHNDVTLVADEAALSKLSE